MRPPLLAGFVLAGLLGALCALGDARAAERHAASLDADSAPRSSVGPNEAVITVNDFCADHSRRDDACKTVVSRAQFEALADALQPDMSPALRLKVADSYARMLKMAAAASARGLDRTPAFEQELRYARLQLLSQDLSRALQAQAAQVSDADVQNYYQQNRSSYQQATLARIFVPRAQRPAPLRRAHAVGAADAQSAASAASVAGPATAKVTADASSATEGTAAMELLAADLRTRAARGEDPDKLQIEADAAAGIPGMHDTLLQRVRASTLPPSHAMVMELPPGDVSEVLSDPGGAHFIYKMIAKAPLPLAEVSAEIHAQLAARRYRELIAPFEGDVVFNDAYFSAPAPSPPPAPAAAPAPSPRPAPAAAPAPAPSAPATPTADRNPPHIRSNVE